MATATATATAAAETASPPSSWQSPVPYLFCALAAMLGLIAFALFILVCSYWKLYESRDDNEEITDVEAAGGAKAAPPVVGEKYLVIMAGQEKPTFLATPTTCTRASSFGDKKSGSSETSLALEEKIEVERLEM